MDCLRAEVATDNIHCLTVCPGSVKTNIAINSLSGDGTPQNESDKSIEEGMDVSMCCRQIIKAIEKQKVSKGGNSKYKPRVVQDHKYFDPEWTQKYSANIRNACADFTRYYP